jgi:hypothetical protein
MSFPQFFYLILKKENLEDALKDNKEEEEGDGDDKKD